MKARPDPIAAVRSLSGHRRATGEEIRARQDRLLRRVVRHAYRAVPYYRRLFDAHGVGPHDIRGAADLRRLPVTSRETLQSLPARDVIATGVDPETLIVSSTSGSSGVPLVIRRTWLEQNVLHLFRLRALRSVGGRPTDVVARISPIRPGHVRDNKALGRALRRVGLFRRERLDMFMEPAQILARLHALQPDVLSGYPGVIARVAGHMADGPFRVRPRLVTTGAEVLTPDMRRRIADGFAARVFDIYGSHEFNLLAWECAETGEMHICDDALIVEVLRDGRPVAPGERGEVVATGLYSYAMPFIRYRLGDIATRGRDSCACGLAFSTIRKVQGRMLDFFPLPDGRVVHPYDLLHEPLLEASDWTREYRLVQERIDRVVLYLVPRVPPSIEQTRSLRAHMTAALGPGIDFRLVLAARLPPERSGKFRVSRSLVRSAYDGIDWDRVDAATSS